MSATLTSFAQRCQTVALCLPDGQLKTVLSQLHAEMLVKLQTAAAVPEGYRLLKNSTHDERSWPGDSSHENGNYHCNCYACGRVFTGYKRRVACRVCSAPVG